MSKKLKKLTRERMKRTGERYTTARMRIMEECAFGKQVGFDVNEGSKPDTLSGWTDNNEDS